MAIAFDSFNNAENKFTLKKCHLENKIELYVVSAFKSFSQTFIKYFTNEDA